MHFRATEMPLLFSDICFAHNRNYGRLEYVLIQELDSVIAYLTPNGVLQAREIGLELLRPGFAEYVFANIEGLNNRLGSANSEQRVETIAKDGLPGYWKRLETLLDGVSQWHLYCEQPVLAPLEEMVLETSTNPQDGWRLFDSLVNDRMSGEQKRALHIIKRLGGLRSELHANYTPLFDQLYAFAGRVSERYGITREHVLLLRARELEGLLTGGAMPDAAVFARRRKGAIIISNREGRGRHLTGAEYEKWKSALAPKQDGVIVGSVAYAGRVRGRVRMHLSLINAAEIPQGSVVVAGMTNPRLVPFLKRAAAIVTDEGGAMCHAAMVARELKIPCITGTKNATHSLKERDIVEVDAYSGMVEILRKTR